MPHALEELNTKRFILAAVVLSVVNFLGVFDGLVVTVAIPEIQRNFGIGQVGATWVITAYALPLGALLLFGGRCGDRYGRRRVLIVGLYLFVGGLLLSGLAQTAWQLFAGRALQGAGAALAIPNTYAMISAMRSVERRNRMFAAVAVAGSTGAAVGAMVGGAVTQTLGWREIFFLLAPVALAAVLAAPYLLAGGTSQDRPTRLNATAAVMSTAGLMLLILGLTEVEHGGLWSWWTLGLFVLSAALLGAFLLHERYNQMPLLRLGLFRLRSLRAAIEGMPGQVFAYQGTVFIGLLFFQRALGYSPIEAGLAFVPLGLAAFVASPLVTRILRSRHWTGATATAQAACAAGLWMLTLASPGDGYVVRILPALTLLGLGVAVAAVSLNIAAGKNVAAEEKGAAYGLFETSTHVSGTVVVASLGTIAAARTGALGGASPDVEAVAAGYQFALAVAAVAALASGVATLILGRPRKQFSS